MGIITMRISNIGYLFKEGIRGIFLHGFMSVAAICVTIACLLIGGSFYCLMYNVNIMVEDLNKTNEVLVIIDENLSDAEAKSVGTQINQVENVYKATFKSREEALKDFIADHQDEEAFNGVDAEDLRHRFIVVLEDNAKMRQTIERLEKIPGVVKINAASELAEGFSTLQSVLRIATVAVAAVLLLVGAIIIYNTVKLAMQDRRDEIAIMKMVGATNGFIRFPYVVEGCLLGLFGAAAAFALQWFLYDLLLRKLAEVDTLQLFSFVAFDQLLVPIAVIFAAAGFFVGYVGSWISIRKFLDV